MNRKISFPIAIIIIVALAVLAGGIIIWQYLGMPEFKLPEIKLPGKTKNPDKCCCGGAGTYFWVDTKNNIIIGFKDFIYDFCGSKEGFYYAGGKGIKWGNQQNSYEIFEASFDYLKVPKNEFESKIGNYNAACEECVKKIAGFIGE